MLKMNRKILTAAALAALALAVPASASAESFGSKLARNIQPSNAGTDGHPCFKGMPGKCTRVMMEGYTNGPGVGKPKAPHDGKIKKLKLIAQGPGSFRPLLAKVKPGPEKAKVVRRGPKLRYDGQQGGGQSYDIETFNVNIRVKKGQYLAVESRRTSFLRCSSGGTNQLLFQPALQLNDPFASATGTDGCWLLLEAVYK
jgi:hypothetical protein